MSTERGQGGSNDGSVSERAPLQAVAAVPSPRIKAEFAPAASCLAAPVGAHAVQLYDEDAFLTDALAGFVEAGLACGDAVVVIATPARRAALEERLIRAGVDVGARRDAGTYVPLDAASTLVTFMVDGRPCEQRFREVVGSTISRLNSSGRRVRAFGEMVALLYAAGNFDAALQLEELWNDLARTLPFSLLCAYPISVFAQREPGAGLGDVYAAHSHVIPAESYSVLSSSEERLRAIAWLQQKASALQSETAHRRKAEHLLRERDATLQALVQASPVPIIVITPDTTVRLWNPAAERVFGWLEAEIVGQALPIVPAEKAAECALMRDAVMRGQSFLGVETYRTRRDGAPVQMLVSAAPLTNDSGVVEAMVLLLEDVTARNRAEFARQKALAEAEAANRAKDEFLAMLGHELRTPLFAVQNAIVTAQHDETRRERALDIAQRQVDHLRRLVDDLLDVARITHGRITLTKQPVRLANVVERAIEVTRPLIEARRHDLLLSLGKEDVRVEVDAVRLEQVVVNLITNAAKYTEPGGRIEVVTARAGNEALLRVRDTGIGISQELLPHVFDLFVQAHRALDRAPGGLGIGLTVARRLVELHGGRVEARSDGPDTGAEFIVRLPALPTQEDTTEAMVARPRAPGSVRILIVEDQVDAAESLMMLLELLGHRVRVVHDGEAAIEAACANIPDVMLVDIGLPGMDGYEVARRLRREPKMKGVILIALTGYGRDEDKRAAIAAGFDYHLVKPIEPAALEGLVANLNADDTPANPRTVH